MLVKEQTYACFRDYLRLRHPSSPLEHMVSANHRYQLCKWACSFLSLCSFDLYIAITAFSYFDRFLCSPHPQAKLALTSRDQFQLVFVTALVLAFKAKNGMDVELDFFTEKICCGMYSGEELATTEMKMLEALSWKLNGPSPHDFIEYYVELLDVDSRCEPLLASLIEDSKLVAASAMMHYPNALKMPSSIALTSMIKAIEQSETFNRFQKVELTQAVMQVIHDIGDQVCSAGIHDIYDNSTPSAPPKETLPSNTLSTVKNDLACLASQMMMTHLSRHLHSC